jgi:hypothetical protein
MGIFGTSAYERWQHEVDAYPILEKGKTPPGSMTVEAVMDNIRAGAMLIEKIKQAAKNGEISASEGEELVRRFQERARKGLGA